MRLRLVGATLEPKANVLFHYDAFDGLTVGLLLLLLLHKRWLLFRYTAVGRDNQLRGRLLNAQRWPGIGGGGDSVREREKGRRVQCSCEIGQFIITAHSVYEMTECNKLSHTDNDNNQRVVAQSVHFQFIHFSISVQTIIVQSVCCASSALKR